MNSPRIDSEHPFQLGGWLIEPDQNRISKPGSEMQLAARCMDVLVFMAAKPGQVISRDDFSDEIWGSSVVTDDALTRYISELRRALGDNSREPAYIETIPKRGYRLIANVHPLDLDRQEPDDRDDQPQTPKVSSDRLGLQRGIALTVGILLVTVAASIATFQGVQ